MERPAPAAERAERATAAFVARELAALDGMTGAALAARLEELTGHPARTRNRVHLRKRVAWLLQAKIEGGLSDAALKRIEELAAYFPEKWKRVLAPGAAHAVAAETPRKGGAPVRDSRLPAAGAVVTRFYNGVEHRVTVLAGGFEYQGKSYRSLSAVARQITNVQWNGLVFFGLSKTQRRTSKVTT